MFVLGTRPEVIKIAPIIKTLEKCDKFSCVVCAMAQHREMMDTALEVFNIKPDYDADLMKKGQTLTDITTRVLSKIESILLEEKPDLVLVQGDTSTAMTAALAAFYQKIPVAHIEAGLRSGDIYSPYPEEMNRKIISNIATFHFAPTKNNADNLLANGVKRENIIITGNTVIDALHMVITDDYIFSDEVLNKIDYSKKIILLTAHRREYWGESMKRAFKAIRDIVIENPDTQLIFPVHLNPNVMNAANEMFSQFERIHLIKPLDYKSFANLMNKVYLIITDSGGIQEEAPSLGKPVIVIRNETERQEAIEAGTVKLAGVEYNNVYAITKELLTNINTYSEMAKSVNPYGDGKSSQRILDFLSSHFI
ncbi:MAG: UDP-N-acetylglucosamine 2-epimerase (non-hydrolyzing) [Methanofastidiosum sp.]